QRLVIVIPSLACGGAERQFVMLARHLSQRGWEPIFVVLSRRDAYLPFLRELDGAGIRVEFCQMYPGLRALPTGLRLGLKLRALRPAVVQGVLLYGNLVARMSRLIYWAPVNVSAARNTREGPLSLERWYTFTDPLTDMTVQNSEAGAARFLARRYVSRRKIRVIPNAIDLGRFTVSPEDSERLRTQLGLHRKFVWLSVGRLVPNKGYPCLIRAFKLVSARAPNAVLLIVGAGEEKSRIEDAIRKDEVGGHVILLGQRDDVPLLMGMADAFVMASKWEGFPNVLLEAAAAKLPIVATDVGASRMIVKDGTTGYLVPPDSVDFLAERMLHVTMMPGDQRKLLGVNACQLVTSHYEIANVSRHWSDLYLELLSNKTRGKCK
ncbi:MAG: glycosyltransferase, partial [Kiritimatiellae bacterium]|nr:glycosyltransferase [Kiritimatiellia bacterium]